MDKKSLGMFLAVLGVIFLSISGITIWSMFFDYDVSKGALIILSIPLMAFSFTTIFFGIYADSRLNAINELRNLVLLPLMMVGIFILIYGVFLVTADMYIGSGTTKKQANQILGLISIAIGLVNIISFVVLISTSEEQPIILSFFWLLLGIIFVYFGVHLIIKKIEDKKKSTKKKK